MSWFVPPIIVPAGLAVVLLLFVLLGPGVPT
jgi:hypothetical protein